MENLSLNLPSISKIGWEKWYPYRNHKYYVKVKRNAENINMGLIDHGKESV